MLDDLGAGWLRRLAAILTAALPLSLTPLLAQDSAQKTFATPEEAVVAVVDAAKANNTEELNAIFGPEGQKILSSGDPVADQNNREVFVVAYEQGAWLEPAGGSKRILYIGNEDWPFPVPLVKVGQAWKFDSAAGVQEVLYRRIGRNELNTIRVCNAYVAAQREYAHKSRSGKPAGLFAQKIVSDPGTQNGLYWKVAELEEPSPFGELAAEAAEEGYRRREEGPTPFHGYFFRILTSQGANAKGGAKNYIVDGEMSGGFAFVARPAEYGNSGVMTFIVNQDGTVYEKDLGPETARLADEIKEYDPDSTWRPVQ
jgi:hypothetical protein